MIRYKEISMIYICDIDGTLANHQGIRSPYDESKVSLDVPLPTCQVIESLLEKDERNVIFFSGRTEACRKDTEEWLKQNLYLTHKPQLYMRAVGDQRSDDILKEEMYNKYIKDKYSVLGVFDDRLKVCRMWYRLGLFVFNCNQGLKEF